MKKMFVLLFALMMLTSMLGIFGLANAADATTGLTISPVTNEVNAAPGEVYSGKVKVTNSGSSVTEVTVSVKDFGAQDETGQPAVLSDDETTSYSMKSWVKVTSEKFELASKEAKEINYSITVPTTAEPGGHYGMIMFAPSAKNESSTGGSQVTVGAQIGSMILLNVSGDATTKAEVEEFSIAKKLYSYNPAKFTSRILNSGSIHVKPVGSIVITNAFGKEAGKLTVNEAKGNVLPDQIRKFENEWSVKKHFGWYTARLSLTYGGADTLNDSLIFFVIPWKETAGAVLILVVLFYMLRHMQWKKENK